MRCETCHRNAPEDAAFCPYCGDRLREGEPELAAFEYAAFISYRHLPHDQEVAKRVQQAIETYRLPRGISWKPGSTRLGKCFRDEDELAATHSLPDRILDALSKSSSLVVVCSPDTAESTWVQREVEAFIEMHGCERVFAALADGTVAESIPAYLKTGACAADGADGPRSSPLAADMRPGASGKAREENLRLIAAIANCGFDDLKQRDRARRRKRGALAATATVLVIAAVASALVFASSARQDALLATSRKLASESEQLLARGDRYGALEAALEALPDTGSSREPYAPEAREALEAALQLKGDGDSLWLASYEIRTEAPLGLVGSSLSRAAGTEEERASVLAVSDDGGYFAVSDGDGNVSTYDTLTGRKLADCIMPDEATPLPGGLYARTMGATEHYLLVGNGTSGGGVLAWFEARTGDRIGVSRKMGCPVFDNSYGNDLVSMVMPFADGGYGLLIADLASGQNSGAEFRNAGPLPADTPYFNTPGARLGSNYAAFGNRLFSSELDTKTSAGVTLAYPRATSLSYVGGLVVAASADPMPTDEIDRRYAIEAFDENLALKWRYEGTFSSEMTESNGIRSLVEGEPVIKGLRGNGAGVLVSVGREIVILDPRTGSRIDGVTFEHTVVDATGFTYEGEGEGLGTVIAACCNGTLNCRDFFEGSLDAMGDGRRLTLPFPIRWARMTYRDGFDILIAIPADSNNRIVSFRTNWARENDSAVDHSLDELIDRAHGVLADGGRR